MKKLFQMRMTNKTKAIVLSLFILFSANNIFSQTVTVLPNNAVSSGKNAPQGSLRYQRIFYLITPAEMNSSGLSTGTPIKSIGFTLSKAQGDTTNGNVKVYLQNTTDLVSRIDTNWNTVTSSTNVY